MRSDEHFTHDGRPETEDGHPTPQDETAEHHTHPCCHHGHPHGRGHGRGGFEHGHGRGDEHGFHRHPTLVRSIMKSARRIRRSGLTPEQLQHRIAATVSHTDYVTTMRTLRRIGADLRDQH